MELAKLDFELRRTVSELENCNGSPVAGVYNTQKLSVALRVGCQTTKPT